MKKLILSLLMMLPIVALADVMEIDGIYYNLFTKAQVAEVTSNPNQYSGYVTIPENVTYNGMVYSVTSISNEAFIDCIGLISITIPNSVTSIGNSAFYQCSGLTSVTIGNSVTSIGMSAFCLCYSLTSIVIPNSVTSIGSQAFYKCSNMKSAIIGSGVTCIGSSAFAGCSGLTSINIPSSVTNIGDQAFEWCSGLESVNITDLESWCKISFDGGTANPLFHAQHLYMNGSEIKDLVIPNGVTSIGEYAFVNCSGLTSVNITNSVVSIGHYAFENCSGLTSVSIGSGLQIIGYSFRGCTALKAVHITDLEAWCKIAFPWGELHPLFHAHHLYMNGSEIKDLVIPNGVTSISNYAFLGCSGLTSVTIPNSMMDIGIQAFSGCSELINVTCLAKVVPNTKRDVFKDSYIEYTTLHVPESSISAYQAIEPWKDFKSIVKIDMPKHLLVYIVDGEVYKSYEIEEGETITIEPAPTKEGYTFSGWSEIPETMPAYDVTVTGLFTVNKYKLIYKVDGEEYKSYEVDYGTSITPEAAPTKEGYTFSGWSEIPETMPARDVTVTGTFTINKYKLTYTVNDEEYKSYELDYGASITPEAEPAKEGYTFIGWSEIPETMPAHDVTVTGSFTINSYKLTYMIDDKVYKETMYEYGATITPESQPEGDYATFEWIDLPQTMPPHDVIVYASYTSGIIEVLMTTQCNIHIYSPNGKKLDKLQKGLNIVVLDDGTVKKVVVK